MANPRGAQSRGELASQLGQQRVALKAFSLGEPSERTQGK